MSIHWVTDKKHQRERKFMVTEQNTDMTATKPYTCNQHQSCLHTEQLQQQECRIGAKINSEHSKILRLAIYCIHKEGFPNQVEVQTVGR